MFRNVSELLALTEEKQCSISEVMIHQEMDVTGKSREEILNKMRINLATMEAAVKRGIEEDVVSVSGLTGGDGKKLAAYIRKGNMIGGETTLLAVANAMATNESMLPWGQFVRRQLLGLPAWFQVCYLV